ncbi:RNA polymerase sigma-70 factor [Flexithrix dorotheae]|uniref:RNA polymerase sigma-70 factor n=1 Tax=Flexithrix dorotheae TaxID=70993 RepID=UPI000362096A|nr:RNA polymerase sigma-70 factor [Flexithrix dorotheae]
MISELEEYKSSNQIKNSSIDNDEEDRLLLLKLKQNNRSALNNLFDKYYNQLCNFCHFLIEQKEESEEIVTDLFLKIWQNRATLQIHSNLRAYLFSSIKYRASAYFKSRKNKERKNLEDYPDFLVSENQADSELLINELSTELNLFLNAIPEPGRTIFRLSKTEGMKYKEISQIMNISEKTVENHLLLVVKKLKSIIFPNSNA